MNKGGGTLVDWEFLNEAADNFTNDTTKIYYSNYSQTCQHLVKDSTKIKYEVN